MRILIISGQQSFRQQVQAACLRISSITVSIRTAESMGQGLDLALQFEAQVVFLDLTRNLEAGMLALEQLASVGNRIVAVSIDKLSTELMTRMIRAGAREILTQPVTDDEVLSIIEKSALLEGDVKSTQPTRAGKVLMCFSSKGGVGKTTLACNIAVALQKRFGENSVALIDANTQAPNIAPMLDLRPQRWLRDAVAEYKRLDSQLLNELMTIHEPSGLHVLAHSSDDPLGLDFSEDQLSKILLVSKGTYQWTIVDTFPLLSSLNLSLMDLSDEIFLVTEAVVPALRSARYNLEMLQKAGYGENRIRVILNRYTNYQGNVTPDLVAESLAWPIHSVIPYDGHATIATNTGRALIQMFPERPVSEAINKLVDIITNTASAPAAPESAIALQIRKLKNWLDI
jgi:pilus assembly protein CpaE